jgi:hypothetical protein
VKRYLTPKTRKAKTDLVGGSPDDDPVEAMEDIREEEYEFPDGVPDDIMERIEEHMAGKTTTKTLQEVMWELGIEVDE